MVVTEAPVEGEASSSTGARAGRDGWESSRSLSLGGRRKLRVQRGASSGRRQRSAETAPVITITSSGDEGPGDERGRGHDGGASIGTQQAVPNTPTARRTGNQADLTPNFRSAAAMAGWDDEALLSAAIGRGTPEVPSCTNSCESCPRCLERKRGTRTPGQAATPLSAGRRHRRVRRGNGEPVVPIPMAGFNEGDKCGEPARQAEGSHQQPSEGTDNKDSKPCGKSTAVQAAAEVAESSSVKNSSLQLDKLREELTCVVCLDICFEPSTTSCGHSFCRGCLQSVYIKCGMRCPKCRHELRTTSKNDCPINTVLWNTIQLLFPQETAARLKDQKSSGVKDYRTSTDSARTVEAESQHRLGLVRRRIVRPVPWRELGTASTGTEQLRLNGAGPSDSVRGPGARTSFRRASEVLESSAPVLEYQQRYLQVQRDLTSWRTPEMRRQEEEDALLAARLQESFITEEEGRAVNANWLLMR